MEAKRKRDEEWAQFLRKKQKHATKLRTGPDIPYSQKFSDITITKADGTVEVIPAPKPRKRRK